MNLHRKQSTLGGVRTKRTTSDRGKGQRFPRTSWQRGKKGTLMTHHQTSEKRSRRDLRKKTGPWGDAVASNKTHLETNRKRKGKMVWAKGKMRKKKLYG